MGVGRGGSPGRATGQVRQRDEQTAKLIVVRGEWPRGSCPSLTWSARNGVTYLCKEISILRCSMGSIDFDTRACVVVAPRRIASAPSPSPHAASFPPLRIIHAFPRLLFCGEPHVRADGMGRERREKHGDATMRNVRAREHGV